MLKSTLFTTGFKFFFGAAALATIAAITYMATTEMDLMGTITLFGFAALLAFLAGVVIVFRDAELDVPAVQAVSAADAEGFYTGQPQVSPSIWPLVLGVGAVLFVIGVASDWRFAVLGLATMIAATVEWVVQAWADRASGDPAYNARLRGRIMHPLEFPIAAAAIVGFVVWGFSRVMLAVNEHAAVFVFIAVGVIVLATAIFLSTFRRIPRDALAYVIIVGVVAVLVAGIAGAARGERTFENASESTRNTNKVADKSSVYSTITFADGKSDVPLITIGRSVTASVLLINKSDAPVKMVLEAGTTTQKDSSGNTVTRPLVFESNPAKPDGQQLLTMRIPTPGTFKLQIIPTEGGGATVEVPVVVP